MKLLHSRKGSKDRKDQPGSPWNERKDTDGPPCSLIAAKGMYHNPSAGSRGISTSAPGYGPSKAGMDALAKTLARQLGPYGINVNTVSPHAIETEMSAQWSEERRREIIVSIPLRRLGKPQDVAEAVLFLASDEASFITGEILDVNGGALMD